MIMSGMAEHIVYVYLLITADKYIFTWPASTVPKTTRCIRLIFLISGLFIIINNNAYKRYIRRRGGVVFRYTPRHRWNDFFNVYITFIIYTHVIQSESIVSVVLLYVIIYYFFLLLRNGNNNAKFWRVYTLQAWQLYLISTFKCRVHAS